MPTTANFADRLLAAVQTKGTPLCVGIDPSYDQLPPDISNHRDMNDPEDVEACVDAILEFSTRLLKVIAPHVAVVKINSAFFEQYYSYGIEAFWAVAAEAKARGLIVINDAKRADIGNTSERYAAAALANSPFDTVEAGADAVTLSPYMGGDSISPFIKAAEAQAKGAFILLRTSNPGSAEIQELPLADGRKVYEAVGDLIEAWGKPLLGQYGYSSIGAVVGATHPSQLQELRAKMPHTLFLVPGYGAQGASAADTAHAFDKNGRGAIINSSRAIIYAHKSPQYANQPWEKAVEAATLAAKSELAAALRPQ